MSPRKQACLLSLHISIVMALAGPMSLIASDVAESNGNLSLKRDDGTIQLLTTQGIDYHPSLSCDGKTVVFVRRGGTANRPAINEELGNRDGNELWVLQLAAPTTPRRVFGGDQGHLDWVGLIQPQLAPDESSLYFLRWFGNGESLYSLSLRSGEVRQIVDSAVAFSVVCSGVFKGGIVVQEDHLKLAGGHVYLYWLLRSGSERLLVGTTAEDASLFLGHSLARPK